MTFLDLVPWLVVLACLAAEAFFAGAELSLVSAGARRLEEASRAGDPRARRALWFREQPERLFGTTLLGTILSTVTGSTVAALALIAHLGPAGWWAAILLMAPIFLIGAQIVPKSVAQARATALALRLARPLYAAHLLLAVPVSLIRGYARLLQRALGIEPAERPAVSREELVLLMAGEGDGGEIEEDERQMISRIFGFSRLKARDVMIPRVEMCAVPEDATVREAAAEIAARGFSRLPVYRERIDEMVGLLHHIDLLAAPDGDMPVRALMREPLFVPESQEIDDILVILQRSAASAALVVDEFGGVVGLLTLEDILEEIVGDIDDEFDHGTGLWRPAPGGDGWIVSGRAPIEKLNEAFGLSLPVTPDYESLAGYILETLKYIPQPGESLTAPGGVRLTIQRASDRAIEEVLLTGRLGPPSSR